MALLSALLASHPARTDVLTRVTTHRPVVAITINDGPEGSVVPSMLQMLRSRGAQATFFVSGQAIASDPQMLLEIQAARCEVANHGFHHVRMRGWPLRQVEMEVARTDRLITSALGAAPHFLRPPFGQIDRTLQEVARRHGERIVLWSVGGGDETVHVWPRTLRAGDIISLRDDREGLRRLRQALDLAARLKLQPVTLSALVQG